MRWTRFENWETQVPRFVELAVEGAALFLREGTIQAAGPRPKVERHDHPDAAAAEAALIVEHRKLRRKKYVEERTFEGDAPTPAELASGDATPALLWPPEEAARRKAAFFERLRALGIDPSRDFLRQADAGDRTGSEGADARERDADARAAAALKLAREVLGKPLGLTWQQQHDGWTLHEIFPSAESIFRRAARRK